MDAEWILTAMVYLALLSIGALVTHVLDVIHYDKTKRGAGSVTVQNVQTVHDPGETRYDG
jgi:hypothetical protein